MTGKYLLLMLVTHSLFEYTETNLQNENEITVSPHSKLEKSKATDEA